MELLLNKVLADTHTAIWSSEERHLLSKPAQRALEDADEVLISAMSLREMAWLVATKRLRVEGSIRTWIQRVAERYRIVGINEAIAVRSVNLPEGFPPDPADQLIAATAMELEIPLVTKDRAIRTAKAPGLKTIW